MSIKTKEDVSSLKEDLTNLEERVSTLESDEGKGLTDAQINALDVLAKCLRDAGCEEEYDIFYDAFFGGQPAKPISILWSGTTATINNLANTSVSWNGTVATIGA